MTVQGALRALWGKYGRKGYHFTIETWDHYGADPDFTVTVYCGKDEIAEGHGWCHENDEEDEAAGVERPFDYDESMERSLIRAIQKVLGD